MDCYFYWNNESAQAELHGLMILTVSVILYRCRRVERWRGGQITRVPLN